MSTQNVPLSATRQVPCPVLGVRAVAALSDEAMKVFAKTSQKLTPQQKFKLYDRHRAEIQSIAQRLYGAAAGAKKDRFVIRFLDL